MKNTKKSQGSRKPGNDVPNDTTRRSATRRKLLRKMAGGGGAAVVTATFSDQWLKPVVESVVLPAHAQTSLCGDLSATASFFSNDTNDTPENAGPFTCGQDGEIETGDADFGDIVLTGIAANVSPPGTPVSLEVSGDAVNAAASASGTSQTQDSDPTNGDVAFADITLGEFLNDGVDDAPSDAGNNDPSLTNTVLTFTANGCQDCVIGITFQEGTSA